MFMVFECLNACIVSQHRLSQGMQCLQRWWIPGCIQFTVESMVFAYNVHLRAWNVLGHAMSWGMECPGVWRELNISGHAMSWGMQCLEACDVSGHATSWGMQRLRACNVSGHAMSQGMHCPENLKSRASNILGHELSYCFRACNVSGNAVFRGIQCVQALYSPLSLLSEH